MDKNNKNITALYCLAMMFTAWCTWNSVNNGNLLTKVADYRVEVYTFERQVASLIDRMDAWEQRDIQSEIKELESLNQVGE